MRHTPPPDADRPGQPAPADPAAGPETTPVEAAGGAASGHEADASDESTAPSLVWPPAEDELNDWEVLHVQSTGHTIIEPMKYVPSASTPAPYAPPAPIDDPAGDTSLMHASGDLDLPETELIEPLTIEAPHPTSAALPAAASPAAPGHGTVRPPAAPDDRTVMIARPSSFARRPESFRPEPARPEPARDDSTPGATRILVAPAFAASVGHAPTVPVSALHRGPQPPEPRPSGRSPMEDTLPAGVTREIPAFRSGGQDHGDDTILQRSAQADTHPVPIAVPRRAPAGPPAPPTPFSRVPSRGPQPAVEVPASPPPVMLPSPPLAFGPRMPAGGPAASPAASTPAFAIAAPAPVLVPPPEPAAPAERDVDMALVAPVEVRSRGRGRALSIGAGVVFLLLLLAVAGYQVVSMRRAAAAAPAPATLSVESSPAGAVVSIDGKSRGKTPLRLDLPDGPHALDVALNGATRHIPLTLAAGTVTAHSFEFAVPVATPEADSAVEVRSEPGGGRVLIDNVPRGTTPIVVTGLTSGPHEVKVSSPSGTVTRTVNLVPKQQTRLVVTTARSASPAEEDRPARTGARAAADTGYIAIQSPIALRVVRNGDFVGTSDDARLALPIGNQVIGLENESVGFRDVRTVEVLPGKTTPVPVVLPKGEMSINARPWAEVFVDGARVGETPVSQMSLPVGIHEVVFRHPDLGERRVSVVVKIGATGRAFVDFTK